MVFMTNLIHHLFYKMSENSNKNVHRGFPEYKRTSSNALIRPTNSLNPKDIQFTIIKNWEKQRILVAILLKKKKKT